MRNKIDHEIDKNLLISYNYYQYPIHKTNKQKQNRNRSYKHGNPTKRKRSP